MSFYLYLTLVLGSSLTVAAGYPVTRNRTSTQEGRDAVCNEKSQMIEEGTCMLFLADTAFKRSVYHEIICVNPTEEQLYNALETYASAGCGTPLKIYIPELKFLPSSKVFSAVAEHLNALTIKTWDPNPIPADLSTMPGRQTTDYDLEGSPFEEMKNLKVLDIAFAGSAKFTLLSKHFFDGLDSLEALHIENLPSGASIAPETLPEAKKESKLKCLGLLTSTIPCSCDKDDSGYWLHEWLHAHAHTWTAEGKSKIRYTDELTSDGTFFLCEVKVTCEMTVVEPESVIEGKHNKKNVKKSEIPFHHFNWKTRCHPATVEASTLTSTSPVVAPIVAVNVTVAPCQYRSRRSDEKYVAGDNDGPCKDNASHRVVEEMPVPAAMIDHRYYGAGADIAGSRWLVVALTVCAIGKLLF